MGKKQKYKIRADGRRETMRTYKDFGPSRFTGVKHFYGKSDDDVDQKIQAFEDQLKNAPAPRSKLISKVAESWWEVKEPKLSPNSVPSFLAKQKEIVDEFGEVPVAELTAKQIYLWLSRSAARGYSQRSISDRKSVLNLILNFAIASGELDHNPCRDVPFVEGVKKKKRRPASEDDVQRIEEHREDSMIARLYYFMEYSGCRIGEAAVLQEQDIDRDLHKARITKDLAFDGNLPLVKDRPKTEAGEREVDLYDNVLEILPQYKDPKTFIFFPDGLPHKSRLQRMIKKYRDQIGITSTAHQLRHTYAGIMHSAEIDAKDTQARMGHSSISITQDIYTDIERQHNEKIRNKANAYIMEERLGRNKKCCPGCGSIYMKAEDGHEFLFCPDCGLDLRKSSKKSSDA